MGFVIPIYCAAARPYCILHSSPIEIKKGYRNIVCFQDSSPFGMPISPSAGLGFFCSGKARGPYFVHSSMIYPTYTAFKEFVPLQSKMWGFYSLSHIQFPINHFCHTLYFKTCQEYGEIWSISGEKGFHAM